MSTQSNGVDVIDTDYNDEIKPKSPARPDIQLSTVRPEIQQSSGTAPATSDSPSFPDTESNILLSGSDLETEKENSSILPDRATLLTPSDTFDSVDTVDTDNEDEIKLNSPARPVNQLSTARPGIQHSSSAAPTSSDAPSSLDTESNTILSGETEKENSSSLPDRAPVLSQSDSFDSVDVEDTDYNDYNPNVSIICSF